MAQLIHRKDYRPFPFEVVECRLSFEIFADHTIVSSQIEFTSNPKYQGLPEVCTLDGTDLEILELKLDGRILENGTDYNYQEQKLELLKTKDKKHFHFAAKVKIDPYNNKSLEGMYRSGNILCTQNEATGFRHITFYPDRPDVMSRFITEIEADSLQYPKLLSNGNLPVAGRALAG
ncbi:MAG: aminopeptidase N, partial [Spirochaetota bacterium]